MEHLEETIITNFNSFYGKTVCSCPKCNNKIIEEKERYICNHCGLNIKKEIAGKYINTGMIKDLCDKRMIKFDIRSLFIGELKFTEKFNIILNLKNK